VKIGTLLSNGTLPPLSVTPVTIAFNPVDTSLTERLLQHHSLTELKRILRHGTEDLDGRRILPFGFIAPNQEVLNAEASGLEGFVFTERKFCARFGRAASEALIQHYFRYSLSLLNGARQTQAAQLEIQAIRDSSDPAPKQYERFITFLRAYVDGLRDQVRALDKAHWSHWSRMYHIFTRAFDLPEWRALHGKPPGEPAAAESIFKEFGTPELQTLRSLSFNTIRWMGTFPIGKERAKGTGGGSPFAMQRFEVDGSLGTQSEVAAQMELAAAQGIRGVFELVLNHTAVDSDLVKINPRLFVHSRIRPHDPTNYFHYVSEQHGEFWIRLGGHIDEGSGQRAFFTDTIQLDLSNRDTRDLLIAQTKDLVRRYGVQAFRVDMAYKLRNDRFRECWGKQAARSEPGQREFLEELITSVKVAFPGVAFIAEAFSSWDELSEDGFDLIYGLQHMSLRGGTLHLGWHDALLERNPERIRAAIQRAEFLHWQEGGADMLTFWGQHDKPAFWRIFGDEWKWGAALLTLMRPGALNVLAGTEVGFEDPCDEDGKVVTFNKPTKIQWRREPDEFSSYQMALLRHFHELECQWGEMTFELIPAPANEHWVGYVIRPVGAKPADPKVLVLANPTPNPTTVTIDRPDLGVAGIKLSLERCGPNGNELVWVP
jgi:hypothetical protein